MRNRFGAFVRDTEGAVTVDWVVLAAAVVGLGVVSVASVRTGSNALATDIQTALSDASVALVCQGGTYQMRTLTGDQADKVPEIAAEFARYSDDELRAGYNDVTRKLEQIREGGGSDEEYNNNLDYLSILAAEMDSRGVTPERGTASFADIAGLDASGCGGSGGGAEAGHELAYYSDPRLQEDYRAYQEEFHALDTGSLHDYVRKIDEQFHEAINNGNTQDAAKLLDLSYMVYQEAQTRDDERLTLDAQHRYDRAYATWLESRR